MARKKVKIWTEAELILQFGLERKGGNYPNLKDWLTVENPNFENHEQQYFNELLELAQKKADFWNEESLKMNFISPLLHFFVKLNDVKGCYESFFDYTISATIENTYLQTETDFMLAKGVGDIAQTPYFHFQENLSNIPTLGEKKGACPPDPVAQLLEAFLIAQAKNQNEKPLYGVVIVGRSWQFMLMQAKEYAISSIFDITQKEDLLQVISVLRKFKEILEVELLN